MRKVQMQLGDNTQGKVISPLTGDTRSSQGGQNNGPSANHHQPRGSDDRDQSAGLPGAQGSKTQTRWGRS